MNFKEAFAKARKEKGAGATFTWNGRQYTTDYKDEKPPTPTRPQARPETEGTSRTSRPRARPSALPSKVTTSRLSDVRNGRGDGATETTRRRSDRAIDRASTAGASNKPTQANTRSVSTGTRQGLVSPTFRKQMDSVRKALGGGSNTGSRGSRRNTR